MKIQVTCLMAAAALIAGCASDYEKPISLNQLPAAAQATVRSEVGNLPISSIDHEYRYGASSYRVEVETKGKNGILWVDPEGRIIKSNRALVAAQRELTEAAGAEAPFAAPSEPEVLPPKDMD